MVKITCSILACFLAALTSTAFAGNISGTYVGLYSNAAELLQIMERPDGSILGRFQQVIFVANATVQTSGATSVAKKRGNYKKYNSN